MMNINTLMKMVERAFLSGKTTNVISLYQEEACALIERGFWVREIPEHSNFNEVYSGHIVTAKKKADKSRSRKKDKVKKSERRDRERHSYTVSCEDARPGTEAARCYAKCKEACRANNERKASISRREERAGKQLLRNWTICWENAKDELRKDMLLVQ